MQVRAYALVTAAYWAFTITDGALRMLVLLYFHELGYSAVTLAFLFLLYEFCGIVTNLFGGWIGTRHGLHRTLIAGLMLQVVALGLLALHSSDWSLGVAVAWVMGAQALSGVAKDLTKMSSKSALKFIAAEGRLFTLVARLTGSKNALKGIGFFVGAALLGSIGYDPALVSMAVVLAVVLVVVVLFLDTDLGRVDAKPALRTIFTKSAAINRLSVARFFLFGSRDIWFVVALPVFLGDELGWSFEQIGTFLAVWVIGYGTVQSFAPRILGAGANSHHAGAALLFPLATVAGLIAIALSTDQLKALSTVAGLLIFGVLFALLSSVHSYLILAYSATDADTAMDVGFYYSANAAGRLVGTLLSGALYVGFGLPGALWGTVAFVLAALVASVGLPPVPQAAPSPDVLTAS